MTKRQKAWRVMLGTLWFTVGAIGLAVGTENPWLFAPTSLVFWLALWKAVAHFVASGGRVARVRIEVRADEVFRMRMWSDEVQPAVEADAL